MPGWFFINAKGEREYETLTPEEAAIDAQIVAHTQALQAVIGEGGQFTSEHGEVIEWLKANVGKLPRARASHQRSELQRTGVTLVEVKAADAKVDKKIEKLADGGKR